MEGQRVLFDLPEMKTEMETGAEGSKCNGPGGGEDMSPPFLKAQEDQCGRGRKGEDVGVVFYLALCYCDKHHDQIQLREERVYFSLYFQVTIPP